MGTQHYLALATIGAANFLFIGLKSFQQRNVAFDNYGWIVPTSFMMAVVEVYVIASIARFGFDWGAVLALGAGGGTGSLFATYIHGRYLVNGRGLLKTS